MLLPATKRMKTPLALSEAADQSFQLWTRDYRSHELPGSTALSKAAWTTATKASFITAFGLLRKLRIAAVGYGLSHKHSSSVPRKLVTVKPKSKYRFSFPLLTSRYLFEKQIIELLSIV